MKHRTILEKDALINLINDFRDEMIEKVLELYEEDKKGWDSPNWDLEEILGEIKSQTNKEDIDPVDIAIYAAFYYNKV